MEFLPPAPTLAADRAPVRTADPAAALFDAAPGLHLLMSAAGQIRRLNRAAERLFGTTTAEAAGQDIRALIHPDDREGSVSSLRRVLRDGAEVTYQNRCRTHDGGYRWFEWHAVYNADHDVVMASAHDVSMYRSTSDILRRSERRYRTLVSNLPGVVYRCSYDARWQTIYMSEAFEPLTGYPVVEFQGEHGRSFYDIVEPVDVPAIRAAVRAAFRTRSAFEVEYRIRHVNGSVRWVYDKGIVVPDDEHWVLDGVMIDITERKRDEAQLRLLEAVVVNARDAVVVTDAEPINSPGPTIVYVNDAFCEMTGYDREDVIGQTPRILQGAGTDRATLDTIRAALERWEPVRVEVLNYRKDGLPFWSDLSIVPVADETGWFTHWIAIQRDVTERKHDEARLRILEKAVDDATESVLVTDTEMERPGPRIVYVNKGFERMTGYTSEEAIGQTPRILQGAETDPALISDLSERLARGERFFGETVNYRKDGTPFNIEWSISPVQDSAGHTSHYVAVQRDVTHSKRYELEREARQRAEEMVRLRDTFLETMSHEIRTPLAGILGFAQVLAEEVAAEHQEFVGGILTDGNRLMGTLNGVLELARLRSLSTLPLEPVDAAAAVRNALVRQQPAAVRKSLRLEAALAEASALAHPGELARLLDHVLDNAVKFTEDGHVRATVSTHDAQVRIMIEDTGVGIGEAFLPFAFDEFKQESAGTNRHFEGSGLGLTLARRQAELMGGTLSLERTLGQGMRVLLTLSSAT